MTDLSRSVGRSSLARSLFIVCFSICLFTSFLYVRCCFVVVVILVLVLVAVVVVVVVEWW